MKKIEKMYTGLHVKLSKNVSNYINLKNICMWSRITFCQLCIINMSRNAINYKIFSMYISSWIINYAKNIQI